MVDKFFNGKSAKLRGVVIKKEDINYSGDTEFYVFREADAVNLCDMDIYYFPH